MKRALILLALIAAAIYGGDYVWLRVRLEGKDKSSALGSVTYYLATATKNGKVEVFYDQPQTQPCVYSLFPHMGYTPCWYLQRNKQQIKQISFWQPRPAPLAIGAKSNREGSAAHRYGHAIMTTASPA